MTADWRSLTCPYCNKEAEPPRFPEGNYPISNQEKHECGALYYVDRSDRRTKSDWDQIRGTNTDWMIVHNYSTQVGMVAVNLEADFDVLDDDDRLVHVIFKKTGSK